MKDEENDMTVFDSDGFSMRELWSDDDLIKRFSWVILVACLVLAGWALYRMGYSDALVACEQHYNALMETQCIKIN